MIERHRRVLVVGSPALAQVMKLVAVAGNEVGASSSPQWSYQVCCCRTQQDLAAMVASNELPPDVIVVHLQTPADRLAAVKFIKASLYRWIPIIVLVPGDRLLWDRLSLLLAGASRVMRGPSRVESVLRRVAKLACRWTKSGWAKKGGKKKTSSRLSVLPMAA